jgi:formamidopyrimidine-DNA glycosylase
MPELPDVEVLKNYCRQNILDRKIDSLVVKNNRGLIKQDFKKPLGTGAPLNTVS